MGQHQNAESRRRLSGYKREKGVARCREGDHGRRKRAAKGKGKEAKGGKTAKPKVVKKPAGKAAKHAAGKATPKAEPSQAGRAIIGIGTEFLIRGLEHGGGRGMKHRKHGVGHGMD